MVAMAPHPRMRLSYWPRIFPRALVKTSVLVLGILVWLLYFYSGGNDTYESRPSGSDSKRADGFILRRPTIPLFEGEADGDTGQNSSVVAEDISNTQVTKSSEVRRGGYIVLENLLESRIRFEYNQSVTITTHATYELLDNLIYLSQRWMGPISVAVYALHEDFKTALLYALWLRRCYPTVADYVTFHFVYPAPETTEMPPQALRSTLLNATTSSATAGTTTHPNPTMSKHNELQNSQEPPKGFKTTNVFTNSSETLKGFPNSTRHPKVTQNSPQSQKGIQISSASSKGPQNSSESLMRVLNSAESQKALQNSTKYPRTLQNSSYSTDMLQNSPDASKALKISENAPTVLQNSPPTEFHYSADSMPKAVQNTSGSSMAIENTLDATPKSLKNQHESLKAIQNSPESSTKLLQNSTVTPKALWDSVDASPMTFQNAAEGPTPFQEPIEGYEQLARGIIGRYSNDSSGPSCDSTSYSLPRSYRHRHHMSYPINVCRNVARLNAKTHYVLASDIELYPSAGVIPMFLELSKREGLVQKPGWEAPAPPSFFLGPVRTARHRVFVLPIFEVDKSVGDVPATKEALVDLYRRKKAVYFHKYVCSFCNIIPRLNRWLVAPVARGRLGIFMTIKRHKPFNRWEPIYIGTNKEPLYDERLSWEGQQDKMSQMYELCLMDYELAILDNAFLVHRPGIKTKNATEYQLKSQFIAQNNKIYKNIIQDMERKYGSTGWCK